MENLVKVQCILETGYNDAECYRSKSKTFRRGKGS